MKYIIIILIFTSSLFSQSKFVVNIDSNIVNLSRTIALQQVGVIESKGKNRSPKIDEYNRIAGVSYGSPYCCSGQYYCYEYASQILNKENPLPRTAVASNMFNLLAKRSIRTAYKPAIDDFIVWQYKNSWKGHIERIIDKRSGGWIRTIAFNVSKRAETGNDGNDGVMIKTRNILHILSRMRVRGLIGVNQCSSEL